MNKTIRNVLTMTIYKLLLEYIYVIYIVPTFGYSGFLNDFSLVNYIVFWVVFFLFLPGTISLYGFNTPSNSVLLIFFLVGFIPGLVVLSWMPQPFMYNVLFVLYWLFMQIFGRLVPVLIPPRIKSIIGDRVILLVVIFFSVFVVFLSGKYAHFRLNFNLFNVYTLRDEVRALNMPVLFTYLFASAKVVIPIISIYFYSIGKKMSAIMLVGIQFLAFSIDGSKSALFSIAITYFLYFILNTASLKSFTQSILGISLLSILEPVFFHSINIITLFVRRLMFLPNLLSIYYFNYFSGKEKDIFRQGILGRIGLQSPYKLSIPNLIGFNYFGSETMVANNGLFADAYSNLGIIGVIILPLMIVVMLRFLDGCTSGLPIKMLIAAIVTTAYTFISSSFFTVMLTHGFIIVCIVLWLIPKKGQKNENIEAQIHT